MGTNFNFRKGSNFFGGKENKYSYGIVGSISLLIG